MIARTILGRTLAVTLSLALSQVTAPVAQAAAPHLVDQAQVVARLVEKAQSRDEKVKLFQDALGTREARQHAKATGLRAEKLRAAVPHLSDKELADLSQRALKAKDIAAGYHSHGDDSLVILGLVLLLAGVAILVAYGDEYYYEEDCFCY